MKTTEENAKESMPKGYVWLGGGRTFKTNDEYFWGITYENGRWDKNEFHFDGQGPDFFYAAKEGSEVVMLNSTREELAKSTLPEGYVWLGAGGTFIIEKNGLGYFGGISFDTYNNAWDKKDISLKGTMTDWFYAIKEENAVIKTNKQTNMKKPNTVNFTVGFTCDEHKLRFLQLLASLGANIYGNNTPEQWCNKFAKNFRYLVVRWDASKWHVCGTCWDGKYTYDTDLPEILDILYISETPPVEISNVGDYKAVVTKDSVTVGCQTIPKSKVMEIVKAFETFE